MLYLVLFTDEESPCFWAKNDLIDFKNNGSRTVLTTCARDGNGTWTLYRAFHLRTVNQTLATMASFGGPGIGEIFGKCTQTFAVAERVITPVRRLVLKRNLESWRISILSTHRILKDRWEFLKLLISWWQRKYYSFLGGLKFSGTRGNLRQFELLMHFGNLKGKATVYVGHTVKGEILLMLVEIWNLLECLYVNRILNQRLVAWIFFSFAQKTFGKNGKKGRALNSAANQHFIHIFFRFPQSLFRRPNAGQRVGDCLLRLHSLRAQTYFRLSLLSAEEKREPEIRLRGTHWVHKDKLFSTEAISYPQFSAFWSLGGSGRDSGVLEFYHRRISVVKQWKPLQSNQ